MEDIFAMLTPATRAAIASELEAFISDATEDGQIELASKAREALSRINTEYEALDVRPN